MISVHQGASRIGRNERGAVREEGHPRSRAGRSHSEGRPFCRYHPRKLDDKRPSREACKEAHRDDGYSCEFYLDAKEKKYIDECGAANFFGIKDNTYVTPKSTSILPSITNKSLMQLAEDFGMKVERRAIPEEELETFEEAGACGTAAVISPISYLDDLDKGKRYTFSKDGKPGPISTKLYNHLRNIQYGIEEDKHGWTTVVIDAKSEFDAICERADILASVRKGEYLFQKEPAKVIGAIDLLK